MNKKIIKKFILFFSILFSIFLFLFPHKANENEIKTLKKGTLTIGTNATFKPFEYIDENGDIVGFDIDLIRKIAENMNLKLEIIDMPFDSLISALNAGNKIDAVIAGLTDTEERRKAVDFSESYFEGKQYVITLNGKTVKSKEDLANCTVATQISTTASEVTKNLKKDVKNLNVKEYDAPDIMVEDLLLKRIDAVIIDQIVATNYKQKHQDKINLTDGSILNFPIENSCIACSKKNKKLLDEINNNLKKIKASDFYKDLLKKHMQIDITKKEETKDITASEKNSLKNQFITAFITKDRWKQYLKGLRTTLIVTFFAAILGFVLGAILAILKLIKNKKGKRSFIANIASLYISVIRGTPVLVQLLILWLVVLKNFKSGTFVAIVAFGLNSAAYVAEILRGGITSVDIGQTEAGYAMGFSKIQTMMYIVLPQGLKNSIPALCNELISLIKETAVVGYVALTDLTRVAFSISASSYQTFMPLMGAAVLYYSVTKITSLILEFIERRLKIKWLKLNI